MLKAPVPLASSAQPQFVNDDSVSGNISMPDQWQISEHAMGVVPTVEFDERKVMSAIDAVRTAEIAMFYPESPQPLAGMSVEEDLQHPIDPAFKHRADDFAFNTALFYEQQYQRHVPDFDNDPNSLAEFKRRFGRIRETGLERASVIQVKNSNTKNVQKRMAGIENLKISLKQFSGDMNRLTDGLAEIESWYHTLPSNIPGDEPAGTQIARTQEEVIRTVFDDQVAKRNAFGTNLLLSRVGDKLSPDTRQELETRSQALNKVVREDNLYEGIIQQYGGDHGQALKAIKDSAYPGKYDEIGDEELGYIKARLEADVAENDRRRREAVLARQEQTDGTLLKLAKDGKLDTTAIRNAKLSDDEEQEWLDIKRSMDELEIREKMGDLYQVDFDREAEIEAKLIECKYLYGLNGKVLKNALRYLSGPKADLYYQEWINQREGGDTAKGRPIGRFSVINTIARILYWDRKEQHHDLLIRLENDARGKGISLHSQEGYKMYFERLLESTPTELQRRSVIGGMPSVWPSGVDQETLFNLFGIYYKDMNIIERKLLELEKPFSPANVLHIYDLVKDKSSSTGPVDWSRLDSLDPDDLQGEPLVPFDQFVAGVESGYGKKRAEISSGLGKQRIGVAWSRLPYQTVKADLNILRDNDLDLYSRYLSVLTGKTPKEELDLAKVRAIAPGAADLFNDILDRDLRPGEPIFHPLLLSGGLGDSTTESGMVELGHDYEGGQSAVFSYGGASDSHQRYQKSRGYMDDLPEKQMNRGTYQILRATAEIMKFPERQRPKELRGGVADHLLSPETLISFLLRESGEELDLQATAFVSGQAVKLASKSNLLGFGTANLMKFLYKSFDKFRKMDDKIGSEVEASRVIMGLAVANACLYKMRFWADKNNDLDETSIRIGDLLVEDDKLRQSFSEVLFQTAGKIASPASDEELPDEETDEPSGYHVESIKIWMAASDFAKVFYQKYPEARKGWSERTFVANFARAAVDWYADFYSKYARPESADINGGAGESQAPPANTSMPSIHESPQMMP